MTTTTTTDQVHRSKWGYHPCDHATFLLLKAYHASHLDSYRAYRRRARWLAKTVYRVGAEPAKSPGYDGLGRAEAMGKYLEVLKQYRRARTPRSTPEAVKPLELPDDWAATIHHD